MASNRSVLGDLQCSRSGVALDADKFVIQLELLGERLAQRAVIVNDQYLAAALIVFPAAQVAAQRRRCATS